MKYINNKFNPCNNKNNKQKDKMISAKYHTRNKTMMGSSVKLKGNSME